MRLYEYHLVTSGEWTRRLEVFPQSMGWGRRLNTGFSGSATFAVPDGEDAVNRIQLWPLHTWLVVAKDYRIVYAGLVTDLRYDVFGRSLSVSHTDLWWLAGKRFVLAKKDSGFEDDKLVWSGVDGQTLAKRALLNAITPASGMDYNIPVVGLPADRAGSIHRTVYGYNLEKLSDLLEDAMSDNDDPVDIAFRPGWSRSDMSGTLQWAMDMNQNRGTVLEWDLGADDGDVVSAELLASGGETRNVVYGAGEGTEVDMKTAVYKSANSGYIALEVSESFKDASTQAQLNRLTKAALWDNNWTARQLELKVRGDGAIPVDQIELGSTIRWRADDDPFLRGSDPWLDAEGWNGEWELIGIEGDTSPVVSLSFRPRMGEG